MFTQIHAEYRPFIKAQLALVHQMDEDNITQDEIKQIAHKQKLIYVETLENLLLNKKFLLNQPKLYQEELFVLNKLLKHNKTHGNRYAVIRDEVRMKSYQILQAQNRMSRHILRILNYYDYDEFDAKMNDEFVKNQEAIQKINTVDYKPFLKLKENNKVLQEAQKNIKDYYALLEINTDVLRYFSIFEKRMYRLNKYSKYKILPIALYLDHTELGESLNIILYPYNLSIVKLLLVLFISLFLYFIRTQLYRLVERLLYRIKYLQKYSKEIMSDAYQPINILFMTINLHMIIHIYNNFYSAEILTKFFNIVYAVLFTLILYRILNTIASIRINDMDQSDKKIKSEMVNVGIKIINFLIMIMGILLIMHFAGANLATVLSGLGIGGFAIAFAARESLANFLGTISILMSDTFSQGDWIVVDGKQGTVVEIGLRVTTLRTFDNALIAIPNGTIANHDVKNWSKRTIGRRIKMSLGIKYDSKSENIRCAISEIREMLKTHPDIATDKTSYEHNQHKSTKLVSQEDSLGVKRTLLVYLDELSDSSINILVYCFTKTTDWSQWLETKEDVIYKVMDILEKNNLEFAYPSVSLYYENKES
jgi:MscS family membrane protein